MDPKINILISTIDNRINHLDRVILPNKEDVTYIISHQFTNGKFKYIPDFLERKDIKISQIPGKGVTRSRNHAISLADGDIGLFADDDVIFKESYFDILQEVFLNNPEVDVALFKIRTKEGEPEYKNYPDEIISYKKAPSVGTIEIGFRIDKIKKAKIFFDERFGAGQDLLIGSDEKIFIQDCIDTGLIVKFFPKYIVEHPYESTVNTISKYDKRKIWVTGGLDCRINGPIALFKAFFGTLKILPDLIRHRVNPFFYFKNRLSAVIYILRTKHERNYEG